MLVTGVINVILNNGENQLSQTTSVTASADFFATYRADRTEMRREQMLSLDAIISSSASSSAAVDQAEKEKVELTAVMGVEMELEGLIKAVGFEDAVVIASSENVSVILKAETLADEQVARVLQIITDETGKSASNVRIIPIE